MRYSSCGDGLMNGPHISLKVSKYTWIRLDGRLEGGPHISLKVSKYHLARLPRCRRSSPHISLKVSKWLCKLRSSYSWRVPIYPWRYLNSPVSPVGPTPLPIVPIYPWRYLNFQLCAHPTRSAHSPHISLKVSECGSYNGKSCVAMFPYILEGI